MISKGRTFLRRSHLEDNIGSKCFLSGDDLGTSIDVLLVRDGGSFSGSGFDNEVSAIFLGHFLDGFGSDGNSGLIGGDFFGNSDGELFGIDSKSIARSGDRSK